MYVQTPVHRSDHGRVQRRQLSLSEPGVGLADEPPVAVTLAQLPAVQLLAAHLDRPQGGAAQEPAVVGQVLRLEGAERVHQAAADVEPELALGVQVGDADVGLSVVLAAQHQERLQVLLLSAVHRRDQRGAQAEQGRAGGARVRPRAGVEGGEAQADAAGVQHLAGTGALAGLARAGGRVAEARVALFAALTAGPLTEVRHAPAGRRQRRQSEVNSEIPNAYQFKT